MNNVTAILKTALNYSYLYSFILLSTVEMGWFITGFPSVPLSICWVSERAFCLRKVPYQQLLKVYC